MVRQPRLTPAKQDRRSLERLYDCCNRFPYNETIFVLSLGRDELARGMYGNREIRYSVRYEKVASDQWLCDEHVWADPATSLRSVETGSWKDRHHGTDNGRIDPIWAGAVLRCSEAAETLTITGVRGSRALPGASTFR
jgi:hypothetical protein